MKDPANKTPYRSKSHKNSSGTRAWKQDRNDHNRFEKAKMLRNYAKLCKREGVSSDRVRITQADGGKEQGPDGGSNNRRKKTSAAKPSPFAKAQQQAERAAQATTASKVSAADVAKKREAEIRQAGQRRKQLTKLHSARTPKGQPMLSKISTVLLQRITANASK